MNNFKKIGLTALAGSLVTLGSAVAGEMSVSGGINTTLKFGKGGGNTSRGIGSDKDVTFTGGGELDRLSSPPILLLRPNEHNEDGRGARSSRVPGSASLSLLFALQFGGLRRGAKVGLWTGFCE